LALGLFFLLFNLENFMVRSETIQKDWGGGESFATQKKAFRPFLRRPRRMIVHRVVSRAFGNPLISYRQPAEVRALGSPPPPAMFPCRRTLSG